MPQPDLRDFGDELERGTVLFRIEVSGAGHNRLRLWTDIFRLYQERGDNTGVSGHIRDGRTDFLDSVTETVADVAAVQPLESSGGVRNGGQRRRVSCLRGWHHNVCTVARRRVPTVRYPPKEPAVSGTFKSAGD